MNDAIGRQAAINALIRKMRPSNNGDGTMTLYVMTEGLVKETLNDLPSVQPERKTGRWIKTINNNYSPFDNSGEYIGICSECGYKVDLGDGGIYSFCSACGAPMTEGEQDERQRIL